MLRARPVVPAALLLVAAADPSMAARAPRRPVEVSVGVVVNLVDGSPPSACGVWKNVGGAGRGTWRAVLGEVKPASQGTWVAVDRSVRCAPGASVQLPSAVTASSGVPYLEIEGSATAIPQKQMEDEVMLAVSLSLSIARLSTFAENGAPIYERSEASRKIYFEQTRRAVVPVFVASSTESEALWFRELFIEVSARLDDLEPALTLGTISVISSWTNADILLDGGVAGRVAARETTLRNVAAGLHEIAARDQAGREVRQVVRVHAGRTTLTELEMPATTLNAVPYGLTATGINVQGYEEFRRGRDGALVVAVPAGEFLMGNKATERTPLEHKVYVSDFLMDKTGVTWRQYKRFAAGTGTPLPPHEPYWGARDDHPAVFVTWDEAKAYCEWAGGRLPTEAEREKAARGTDGRLYPWGNEEPDPERGVFRRTWGQVATDPVGIRPKGASPYGLLDMGGNVWEWCSDWYDDGYFAASSVRDPKGPATGNQHVVRGGSWDSRPSVLSSSCRNWGHRGYREGDFGFRCAMNAPSR